jgi:hypothetical protein
LYTRFSASSWRLRPSWATHPQQATRRRPWRSGVGEGRRQRNLLTPPTSSNRLPRRIPHHPHPSVVPSRRYKSLQIGASSALIIHLVKVALRLAGLGCLTPCIALVEQIFVLITYVALRPSPAPPPTRSPTHRHPPPPPRPSLSLTSEHWQHIRAIPGARSRFTSHTSHTRSRYSFFLSSESGFSKRLSGAVREARAAV